MSRGRIDLSSRTYLYLHKEAHTYVYVPNISCIHIDLYTYTCMHMQRKTFALEKEKSMHAYKYAAVIIGKYTYNLLCDSSIHKARRLLDRHSQRSTC